MPHSVPWHLFSMLFVAETDSYANPTNLCEQKKSGFQSQIIGIWFDPDPQEDM